MYDTRAYSNSKAEHPQMPKNIQAIYLKNFSKAPPMPERDLCRIASLNANLATIILANKVKPIATIFPAKESSSNPSSDIYDLTG
jgi:hypothetical protein